LDASTSIARSELALRIALQKIHVLLALDAIVACIYAFALPFPVRSEAQHSGSSGTAGRHGPVQRVLLLSIDGMHGVDLARLVNEKPDSALAHLSMHGVTYSNAFTSFPSNSWPGLLSIVTGGSPRVTGVLFENSFDRSLSPPASDCAIVGTPVIFDSWIDVNRDAADGGGGIDRSMIQFPVQTSQIAPTILKLLGLDPDSLDAVRLEKTPLSPGLDFHKLSPPQRR
jgi:type I phosphodiesterase/nucleotide pyrophosphatase